MLTRCCYCTDPLPSLYISYTGRVELANGPLLHDLRSDRRLLREQHWGWDWGRGGGQEWERSGAADGVWFNRAHEGGKASYAAPCAASLNKNELALS
jgi:hypothetical protein